MQKACSFFFLFFLKAGKPFLGFVAKICNKNCCLVQSESKVFLSKKIDDLYSVIDKDSVIFI